MRMMNFLPVLVVILMTGHLNSPAQKTLGIFVADTARVVKTTDSIVYYGVDFSHVRITDSLKVSRNEAYYKVYPPAWIKFIEEKVPPKRVKRCLGKRTFIYAQDEIRSVSVKVVPDFIIPGSYWFPLDTVKAAVQKYNLSMKSGVGLVILAENFSKPKESAKSWVVFFDIRTRKILWATRVSGYCTHMGYTAHWATGVINGLQYFIDYEYR